MVSINQIEAIGSVLRIYQTGDRPVIILCADGYHYICKYKVPGISSYKLFYEFLGTVFAHSWGISVPPSAFIKNNTSIWIGEGGSLSHDPVAPLFGSRRLESVFDLSEFTAESIMRSNLSLSQLLTISLFDIWLANEDRTCNNYNLLYNLASDTIVSIDYGGIFNSNVLDRPLFGLNVSDSILSSSLFNLLRDYDLSLAISSLHNSFDKHVNSCFFSVTHLINSIPAEWGIDTVAVHKKLDELFDKNWINSCWTTLLHIINNV